MNKTCEHCGNTFEANRVDKVFCSKRCKNLAHYHKTRTERKSQRDGQSLGGLNETTMEHHVQSGFNPMNQMSVMPPSSMGGWQDWALKQKESELAELKEKYRKIETENDELKKRNFDLERDVAFKDKEHELSIRASEIEQTSGLGGVLEKVATNPQLAQLAGLMIGRIMGVDAPPAGQLAGGQPQSQVEAMLQNLQNWFMNDLNEDEQAHVYQILVRLSQSKDLQNDLKVIQKAIGNGTTIRKAAI